MIHRRDKSGPCSQKARDVKKEMDGKMDTQNTHWERPRPCRGRLHGTREKKRPYIGLGALKGGRFGDICVPFWRTRDVEDGGGQIIPRKVH